jgi:uncharacterized Fe-S cluster-containing radical SAM superfamily enzyme
MISKCESGSITVNIGFSALLFSKWNLCVQVRIVVSDFQPQGQPGLNQKLQQIVRDLAEIDKLRYVNTVNNGKQLVVKQISQFTDSLE